MQQCDVATATVGDIETIIDADLALDRCGDLFATDPVGCNMVAASLRSDVPIQLLRAHDGNVTLGAALWWGNGWMLTRLRPAAAELLAAAVSTLQGDADRFSVLGEVGDVVTLAGHWSERTGGAFDTDEVFRFYRLSELQRPTASGLMTRVTVEDAARVVRWSIDFDSSIGHPPTENPTPQVTAAISEGRFWMWRDRDGPVAQLWTTSPRSGAVRISGVYTPPEIRGNGYGAALTAAVSTDQLSRSSVDLVMLNTQASNAVANRLFRRLGFEPAFDAMKLWLRLT